MSSELYQAQMWNRPAAASFLLAIDALKSKSMAKRFLADVLTENEIVEFGNRVRTAALLRRGSTYATINEICGLSSTTIARVSDWLSNGATGYQDVLDSIDSQLAHHLHSPRQHVGAVN